VYPVFETFDISGVIRLRPVPLREPSFVLDVHLGTLARYLRLLGFRADYHREWIDKDLASYGEKNKLIILSRDRGLLKRKIISHGMFIYNTDPREQIKEVCRRLDLYSLVTPFSRCLSCGGKLHSVYQGSAEFDSVKNKIPPGVLSWCRKYKRCSLCGKVFWEGSHMGSLNDIISSVMELKR